MKFGFRTGIILGTLLTNMTLVATPPVSAQPSHDYIERAVYSLYAAGAVRAHDGDWAGALNEYDHAYRLRPNSAEILVRYAEALRHNGRADEAVKFALRALDEDSGTSDAWLILADDALARDDLQRADYCLAHRVDLAPDDLESRMKLGFLRESVKNYAGVIEVFRSYPPHRAGAAAARFHLGVAYSYLHRDEEARTAFGAALRENPGYADAARNIAIISEDLGEDSEAIAAWERVLSIAPRDEDSLRRKVMLLLKAERFVEASGDLQQLLTLTPDENGALRRLLAQVAVRNGDLGLASRALLAVADIDGTETSYLEVALVAAHARTETAVLTRSLERAYDLGMRPQIGRLLLQAYVSVPDETRAIDLLERLRLALPNDTGVLWNLGLLHHKLGHDTESMAVFEELTKLAPRDAAALNFVGYSLAERGTRLPEALDMVTRALAMEPENPEYLDSLGWIYFQSHRDEDAREQLERAHAISPDEPTIAEHLGDVYQSLGRSLDALRLYGVAEATGKSENPARLRQKIEALESDAARPLDAVPAPAVP